MRQSNGHHFHTGINSEKKVVLLKEVPELI